MKATALTFIGLSHAVQLVSFDLKRKKQKHIKIENEFSKYKLDTTITKHIKLPLRKHQYSHSIGSLSHDPYILLLSLMLLGKGCPSQILIYTKAINVTKFGGRLLSL
jgi:hypothetical protein